MLDRTCVECDATLTGRQTHHCSKQCANRAAGRKARAKRATPEGRTKRRANRKSEYKLRTCIVCGTEWRTPRKAAKYCSDGCKGQHYSESRRQRPRCSPITVIECDDGCGALKTFPDRRRRAWNCGCATNPTFTAGWCRRCGCSFVVTWNDMAAHYCSSYCLRADARERRRARKHGAPVEGIWRRRVFERDSWRCGICHEDIDPTLVYPDMMSASLDHIVPVARGGGHTYENLQAAHFLCNSRKGDRIAEPSAA